MDDATKVQTHEHVLVVDDAKDCQLLLNAMLGRAGYAVTTVEDGAAGLLLLRATLHPLIALIDFGMPRLCGLDLLEAVAVDTELAALHTFVFMPTKLTVEDEQRLDALGRMLGEPVLILPKPYRVQHVLAVVRQAEERLRRRSERRGP